MTVAQPHRRRAWPVFQSISCDDPDIEKVRGGAGEEASSRLAIARSDEQGGALRGDFSCHSRFMRRFINNARLFLRVRRIKPEGVTLWQRRRRQRANRRVCEPRLEHSDFEVAKRPDCCSAVCLFCLRRFRRRGQSRELEARINSRQNHNLP